MINIILITALMISLITDLKDRKILNIVTLPAILFAITFHTITNGLDGFLFSITGFFVGLLLLIVPFALGGMGAGDVKLLAAIGSLKGVSFVFNSFLFTCLIGGLIAIFILIKQKLLWDTMKRITFALTFRQIDSLNKNEIHSAFPYGVAIVLGTLIVYFDFIKLIIGD